MMTTATETQIPETPPPVAALPLQLMDKQPAEQTVDSSSSHSEDAKTLTARESTQPAATLPASAHKLIGGHRVRPAPSPPSRSGSSASVVEETGTAHWMRKNGTPKRVRGGRSQRPSRSCSVTLHPG